MYSQVQGPQNVILCFAPASQNGLKGKNTRLKHQSEQFVRERKPLSKFFELLLKSRIFSFQSILACRCSQKLHFGDLGLTKKRLCILQFGIHHLYFRLVVWATL